jgi:hypothetical protein
VHRKGVRVRDQGWGHAKGRNAEGNTPPPPNTISKEARRAIKEEGMASRMQSSKQSGIKPTWGAMQTAIKKATIQATHKGSIKAMCKATCKAMVKAICKARQGNKQCMQAREQATHQTAGTGDKEVPFGCHKLMHTIIRSMMTTMMAITVVMITYMSMDTNMAMLQPMMHHGVGHPGDSNEASNIWDHAHTQGSPT